MDRFGVAAWIRDRRPARGTAAKKSGKPPKPTRVESPGNEEVTDRLAGRTIAELVAHCEAVLDRARHRRDRR